MPLLIDECPSLYSLWQRCVNPQAGAAPPTGDAHHAELKALYQRGISLEDALQFLFEQRPTQADFSGWVAARSRLPVIGRETPADTLSDEELRFWQQNGYLVLRGAVPREQCMAAQDAIWGYLGASSSEPASWYQPHPGKRGMMLQFSDHPALQANRHGACIRRVYEQLYGSSAIFASIDKVSFNPPVVDGHGFLGGALHWDVSLQPPIPFKLQGLLYLSDCAARHGAFHCVPGFHHRHEAWLAQVPPEQDPRELASQTLQPVPIEGQAGDFIIWHQALPHCATANFGDAPRMVQYLTYLPEQCVDQPDWY